MSDPQDKKRLKEFLLKHADTWVSQKLLSSQLGLPRWSALINELRNEGNVIAQRMSNDSTPLVEYKLSTVKISTLTGWVCTKCQNVIEPGRMESNTLSPKHSNNYCVQCRKKSLFELRGSRA